MEEEVYYYYSTSPLQEDHPNPRKNKNKNRQRFSEEQIRTLETMFEMETKLEQRKKLQLARELGLQPRQIAIWFQNRRARWKSKRIEQSYRVLKANYDNLHSQFESLKREKQSLLTQWQELTNMLEKGHDGGSISKDMERNGTPGGSDGGDTRGDIKTKPSCSEKGLEQAATYSDDEEEGNAEFFRQEEGELLNTGGQLECSMALPEKWCNFESNALFDQSCGSSNWWDYWT